MKKIILLLFCMPLLLATTCEDEDEQEIFCTLEAVAGLNVTVIDSQTNVPLVEEVVVTATDGTYQETLEYLPGLEYVFSGAWERAGNYIITVSKPGYQTYTSSVITVTSDVCHVIPQQIEVVLTAN